MAVDQVLPVAQEHEVVVRQPLQEGDRLGDLVAAVPRAGNLRELDHTVDSVGHRVEVAHRQPQIAQHPPDVVGERRQLGVAQTAVDLEVHDRLAVQGAAGRGDGRYAALAVTLDAQHRVHHRPHLQAVPAELLADGVDQERGVLQVGFDDRAGGLPPVPLGVRVVGADGKLAGGPGVHEFEQAADLGGEPLDAGGIAPLGVSPARVGTRERGQPRIGGCPGARAVQHRDQVVGGTRTGRRGFAAHERPCYLSGPRWGSQRPRRALA